MSILKNLETYEKMLEKPENRVRSHMRQPMPNTSELKGAAGGKVDISNIETPENSSKSSLKEVSPEDEAFLSAIDKQMALRREGKLPKLDKPTNISSIDETRIQKIEKRMEEIQDLLIEIMKTQMKLINK